MYLMKHLKNDIKNKIHTELGLKKNSSAESTIDCVKKQMLKGLKVLLGF